MNRTYVVVRDCVLALAVVAVLVWCGLIHREVRALKAKAESQWGTFDNLSRTTMDLAREAGTLARQNAASHERAEESAARSDALADLILKSR